MAPELLVSARISARSELPRMPPGAATQRHARFTLNVEEGQGSRSASSHRGNHRLAHAIRKRVNQLPPCSTGFRARGDHEARTLLQTLTRLPAAGGRSTTTDRTQNSRRCRQGGNGSNCACTLTPGTTNVLILLLTCLVAVSIQEIFSATSILPSAVSGRFGEQVAQSLRGFRIRHDSGMHDTVVPIRGNALRSQRETLRP